MNGTGLKVDHLHFTTQANVTKHPIFANKKFPKP